MIKPLQWKGTVDPMITIAIVEDEEAYAKQLTEYIEKYQRESGKSIRVIRFSDGDEIVEKYNLKDKLENNKIKQWFSDECLDLL